MATDQKTTGSAPGNMTFVNETQGVALQLIEKHLAGPLRDIEKDRYSRFQVATALLLLSYQALREGQPRPLATTQFKVLAHYAQRRIEKIAEKLTEPTVH